MTKRTPYEIMEEQYIEQRQFQSQKNKIKRVYQNGPRQIIISQIRSGYNINILKQIGRNNQLQGYQSEDQKEYKSISQNALAELEACNKFKCTREQPYSHGHNLEQNATRGEDPYVVRIFKVYKTPMFYNIQMECCQGTLYDELINDKIANQRPQLCVIYLLSMLYGLTACHMRGIKMHRDIKPQNFLITHDLLTKKLKLADFGVCTKSQQSETYTGTELYQALEVFAIGNKWFKYQNERKYGYLQNCDIYSVGVISYHMYNGPLLGRNKLSFPYKQNILDELQKAQTPVQRNKILKQYIQNIAKHKEALLNFIKWEYTGINKVRMDLFIKLTKIMLQISPEKRPNTLGMYKLINQCKGDLFKGLEHLQVCKDFEQKFKEQQKCYNLRNFAQNNQSTRLN